MDVAMVFELPLKIAFCALVAWGLLPTSRADAPAQWGSGYPNPKGSFYRYDLANLGWFSYQRIEPPETPLEEPEPPESSPVEPTPATPQVPQRPEASVAIRPFSVQWFQVNLPKYRDIAIDQPTDQNVRTFLYLQQRGLEKAERFAQVASQIGVGDPVLDDLFNENDNDFAVALQKSAQRQQQQSTLRKLSAEYLLVFFYRAQCPACVKQAQILALVTNSAGFDLLGVAMDGSSPQSANLPTMTWTDSRSHAVSFGVRDVPTTGLFSRTTGPSLIANGLAGLPDLSKRIVTVAHRNGAIPDDEFYQLAGSGEQDSLTDELETLVLTETLRTAKDPNSKLDGSGFIPSDRMNQIIDQFTADLKTRMAINSDLIHD